MFLIVIDLFIYFLIIITLNFVKFKNNQDV